MAIVLFILVSTIAGILGTFHMAGWLGLFVVGMAWASGFIIAINSLALWGAILLIVALVLGPIACDNYQD